MACRTAARRRIAHESKRLRDIRAVPRPAESNATTPAGVVAGLPVNLRHDEAKPCAVRARRSPDQRPPDGRASALLLQASAHELVVGVASGGAGLRLLVLPTGGAILHLLLLRRDLLVLDLLVLGACHRPGREHQECRPERHCHDTYEHRILPWK